MQNSPLPASALPPPVNAVVPVVVPDTTPASAADSEDFSAVLARELAAKSIEPKPDTAPASAPDSENDSEDFSAVLAWKSAANVIELKPDATLPGAAASASQPHQPGGEMAPLQMPSDPDPAAPALLAPMPGIQPVHPDGRGSGSQRQLAGTALTAIQATETSAPRNLPPAALPDSPALEPGNTADFAAPGRFLPPFAAQENTSRSGTEKQATQRLPDSAPLLQMSQMSYPSSAAAASLATAATPTTQNLKLELRVGTPGWNGELAHKVVWMATRQQQVAELHLNPPHLGPVEVMLTIGNEQGTQASVQFASPHSAAREALEAALPRLREMLADSGIALGNATVSADSFQQRAEAGRQDRALMKQPVDGAETGTGLAGRPTVTLIRSGRNGLVDTFA